MSLASDDPEHVIVVSGSFLAPAAEAGQRMAWTRAAAGSVTASMLADRGGLVPLPPFRSGYTADRRSVGTSAPTPYIGGGGIDAWSLFDRLTRARAGGG